jgi:cytoskeletal protein RodZ
MSQTLGEKLRQAREERGISISDVAEQTRISAHYLDCIENDDYRTLPGGIFNKGFVKSYAKYVGIGEQEALSDYSRLIAQTEGGSDQTKSYRPEVLTDDRTSSSIIPTIVVAVVILGLMSWGLLKLVDYIQNQPATVPPAANANSQPANAAASNANQQPAPVALNEIKLEFRAVSEKISVEATVDGKKASREISPDAPEVYTAQESLKLRYYRGFADKVQLTLNGKQVTAPPAPAKGSGIEFEITKANLSQIVQSGVIAQTEPAVNANVANRNAGR